MSLILIVDDHRDTCRVLSRLVRTLGWQAEAVESGADALDFLRRRQARPDVILLDVVMPGMDGFEALRQIRQLAPDIPVVMMSAIDREEHHQRAAALGAVECWVKGVFDPATLAESLARVALTRRDPQPPPGNPQLPENHS